MTPLPAIVTPPRVQGGTLKLSELTVVQPPVVSSLELSFVPSQTEVLLSTGLVLLVSS